MWERMREMVRVRVKMEMEMKGLKWLEIYWNGVMLLLLLLIHFVSMKDWDVFRVQSSLVSFLWSDSIHWIFFSFTFHLLSHAGCYPFATSDPFIINDIPDVFFIGNQPRFRKGFYETQLTNDESKKTLILLIPKFSQTGQVVLVNLKDLRTKVVQVGVEAFSS